MNMMQLKYIPARRRNDKNDFRGVGWCGDLPISGVVSVMGSMSPTIEEKMVMANIIVTPQITVRYQH